MNFKRYLAGPVHPLKGKGLCHASPSPVGPAGEHASVGGETGHDVARAKTFDERKGGALVKPVYFEKDPVILEWVCSKTKSWFENGPNFPPVSSHSIPAGGSPFSYVEEQRVVEQDPEPFALDLDPAFGQRVGGWDSASVKANTCYPRGFPETHPGGMLERTRTIPQALVVAIKNASQVIEPDSAGDRIP